MASGQIRVVRNFTLVTDRFLTAATCRQIGLELLVQIENRTVGGRDEQRRGFVPYSAKYGKDVKGRLSPVDLKRSGDMLADMDVLVADGRRIVLGFRSDEMAQRAAYHDSLAPRRKMPLRRFLGISVAWLDAAMKKVRLNIPPAWVGMR